MQRHDAYEQDEAIGTLSAHMNVSGHHAMIDFSQAVADTKIDRNTTSETSSNHPPTLGNRLSHLRTSGAGVPKSIDSHVAGEVSPTHVHPNAVDDPTAKVLSAVQPP